MLPIIKKVGVLCALAVVMLAATTSRAYATHFRYGTISWVVPDATHPNIVEFHVEMAFRRSFFSPIPVVGMVGVDVGVLNINDAAGHSINQEILLNVATIDTANDLFIGRQTISVTLPASTGHTYTAIFTNCCRLSSLSDDNHDQNYTISTTVPVNANGATVLSSPVSSSLPLSVASVNHPYIGFITAAEANGHTLQYRFATTAESGLVVTSPPGMTVSSAGVIQWTPTAAGLYAAQFVVSSVDATQHVLATIVVDALFQASVQVGSPPTLTLNGSSAPLAVTIPPGFDYTFAITSTDPDVAVTGSGPTQITLQSGALPAGSTVTPSLPVTLPSGSATATFEWTPTVADAGPHVFVFVATDDRGNQTQRSATITVDASVGLYLSGTIRDFAIGENSDFDRADGDNTIHLVGPTLSAGGKPVFVGTGALTTSAGTFSQWFNKTTQTTTYTIPLSSASTGNPQIYAFSDASFYPIDGLLGGNSGQAHNGFFTYEIHTFYTYTPGQSFSYSSSDDLWVFLNGRLVVDLGGVHVAPKTATFSPDVLAASLGLAAGQTYPLDFFYAHRGATHAPSIGIQVAQGAVCDPIGTPAAVDLTTLARLGPAALNADHTLRLLPQSAVSQSAAAWTPLQQQLFSGFTATFGFRIQPGAHGAEGLAFVLQSESATSRGSAAGNLGYAGITHSLAIELDAKQETALTDPAFEHVSVHTSGAAANSAAESASIGYSDIPTTLEGAPFRFDDGLVHQVRVEYLPQPNPGIAEPWPINFRVTIDNALVPAVQTFLPIDTASQIFGSGAYAGFTTSSDATAVANVDILNFALSTPSISPALSFLSAPIAQTSGQPGTTVLQLRDICNDRVLSGGLAGSIASTLTTTDGYSTAVTVTDSLDGLYHLGFTPLVGGPWQLTATLNGTAVAGSPASFPVSVATATVTASGATSVYNGLPRAATGTAKGIFGETLGALTFTYNGAPQAIDAGTYAVVATYPGNAHYGVGTANASLTITQAAPVVSVTSASFTYDGTPHGAAATAKGVLGEDLGAVNLTYTPGGGAPTAGGSYSVAAAFAGNTNYTPGAAAGTLVINPATPAITAIGGTFTYDGHSHSATASAAGVPGDDLGALTIKYNGSTTPPVDAGSYAVDVSSQASANYVAVHQMATLTINPATPTVTVTGGTVTYDGTPHAVTAVVTGAGGAPLGAATISYNGVAAAPTDAGSYIIVGTFAGGGNYTSATGSGSLTIAQATPTVSVTGGSFTYDGTPHAATAVVTGVGGSSLGAATISYNGVAAAPTDAGSDSLVGTFAGGGNYTSATGSGSLTIVAATPVVIVTGGAFTFDGTAHAASATVTGVGGAALGAATITYNGDGSAPINAGSYSLVGTFSGGGNYTSATGSGSLTIAQAMPTVVVTGGTFTYDGNAHEAIAAVTGVAGASLSGATITYAGDPTPPTNSGTYAVIATFAAGGNYASATGLGSVTISQATALVTVTGGTFTFDGAAHGATAVATGVGGASLGAATVTYNGSAATPTDSGSYSLVGTFAGTGNYAPATGLGVLTISPATPVVTVTGGTFTYNAAPHAATSVVTGVGGVSLGAATLSYAGDPAPPINGGTYPVVGTFAGGGNYTSATGTGSVTITAATATVSVTGGTFVYDGTPHPATGTVTGVGGATIGTPTFSYNAAATAPVGAGPYAVIGSFPGNANYQPAQGVATITIQKSGAALTWAAPAPIGYGTPLSAAQLNATAAVPGTFVYSPAAGTGLGAATQPLSVSFTPSDASNYNTASATTSITIARAPLTVSANSVTKAYGAPLPALSASIAGFVNGDTALNLTAPVVLSTAAVQASPVGAYPVTASGAASPNYAITFVPGTVAVTAVPLTITADNKTMAAGSAVPALTATYAGFVNGDTAASLTHATVLTTTATAASAPGAYPIVASGATDANYAIAFVNGTLTVSPVVVTSLRLQLQAVRAALAMVPRSGNRQNDDHLNDAIVDLDQALAALLWTDGSHLTRRGERVFEEGADAADELVGISRPPAAVTQAIAQLVAIERQLAALAVQDAQGSRVRGAQLLLLAAQVELAQGDRRRGLGQFGFAIQEYGEAWHNAQRALAVQTDHDDHDHDHDRRDSGCRDDR